MITNGNFAEFIQSLNKEDLESIASGEFFEKDYVLMQAHVFNVGGYATIESVDYSEELEEEAHSNGNLLCDADDFLRLIEETNALEI